MKREFYIMIPNDHICINNDEMWFVCREDNNLIRGKSFLKDCECVAMIPVEGQDSWRINPLCIKCRNKIVCLNDRGSYIWTYDLQNKHFEKIELDNSIMVRIGFTWCQVMNNKLWAWASGLKRLIEMDIETIQPIQYYEMADNINEGFAYQVISVGNNIYFFRQKRKELYEFDVISKKKNIYEISEIGENISTVCYDGDLFWFTGIEKCIYTWDKESGKLNQYTKFPQEFKVIRTSPMMLFYRSICVGEYICFVPANYPETICNSILFVNKKNYQMKAIKVYHGDQVDGTYIFQYVRDDRYIGIYYTYNDFISEIDTVNFAIAEKKMKFSWENYTKLFKYKIKSNNYVEKNVSDLAAFINL